MQHDESEAGVAKLSSASLDDSSVALNLKMHDAADAAGALFHRGLPYTNGLPFAAGAYPAWTGLQKAYAPFSLPPFASFPYPHSSEPDSKQFPTVPSFAGLGNLKDDANKEPPTQLPFANLANFFAQTARSESAQAASMNVDTNDNLGASDLPKTTDTGRSTPSTPSNAGSASALNNNIECVVCGDKSSGRHYGQYTCEGCKSFFKRSVRRNLQYTCRGNKNCVIDQHHRNQCQYCRFKKCLKAGMRREAVQQGRIQLFQSAYSSAYSPFFFGAAVNGLLSPANLAAVRNPYLSGMLSTLLKAEPYSLAARYQQMLAQSGAQNASSAQTPLEVAGLPPFPLQASGGLVANSAEAGAKEPLTPVANVLNQDGLCELAARILFSIVEWAKNIPFFPALSVADQIALLRAGWSDLFVLTSAHGSMPVQLTQILSVAKGDGSQDGASQNGSGSVSGNGAGGAEQAGAARSAQLFQEQMERLRGQHVDAAEYSCLKALVLFNPDAPGLTNTAHIEQVQEKVQLAFEEYERSQYAGQPTRFGRLMLRLAPLKQVTVGMIEELFFVRLVGRTPIESLLKDILLNGPSCSAAPGAASSASGAANAAANGGSASGFLPQFAQLLPPFHANSVFPNAGDQSNLSNSLWATLSRIAPTAAADGVQQKRSSATATDEDCKVGDV